MHESMVGTRFLLLQSVKEFTTVDVIPYCVEQIWIVTVVFSRCVHVFDVLFRCCDAPFPARDKRQWLDGYRHIIDPPAGGWRWCILQSIFRLISSCCIRFSYVCSIPVSMLLGSPFLFFVSLLLVLPLCCC